MKIARAGEAWFYH